MGLSWGWFWCSYLLAVLFGAVLACLVGRWIATPDDDELDGMGRWVGDDEEVGR